MNASNVTNIESIENLHRGLIKFSDELRSISEEIKAAVMKAEQAFGHDYPNYWRGQVQLAERTLNEARDQLAAKTSASREEDKPTATEEKKRVRNAETRLQLCNEKTRLAKHWANQVSRDCDQLLGPLSDVANHCDSTLQQAAVDLRQLIDQLRAYTDQSTNE